MDVVSATTTGELRAHPGGGPYNTARTIARLGRPAAYLGALARDAFGQRLRDGLSADGVSLELVADSALPTTLALAAIGAGGAAAYTFYGEGTAAPSLASATLPDDVAMLHVGTLGLIWDPTASTLERTVASAPGGVLVALDPNCRPVAVTDPEGYRARLRRISSRSHLVKVSDEDLEFMVPGAQPVDAARTLLAEGAGAVVVTRGADGAIVVRPDEAEIAVPGRQVAVVDTIGAGDSFGGALLAWWHGHGLGPEDLREGDALVEAATFAALVAGKTCERAGADPPRLAEVSSAAGF